MDPITLALLIGIPLVLSSKKKSRSEENIKPQHIVPKGRGLFINDPSKLIQIDFGTLKPFLKDLKIEWISVLYYNNEKDLLNSKIRGILHALYNAGIKIWLWAIPSAYDIDNFIKISQKYEASVFSSGFILNLDEKFINVQHAVTVLISSLKRGLIKPIGLFIKSNQILSDYIKFDFSFDAKEIIDISQPAVVDGFPVFMISSIYSKLNKLPKASTYAIWDLDNVYGNEEYINYLKALVNHD